MQLWGWKIYPFMIPFAVAIIIQIIKVLIDFFKKGKTSFRQLFSAGGFPSVHSGISSSLVTVVFLTSGFQSPEFAIALVFGFLFVYDAMNLRYEAGEHARYLNSLRSDLQSVLHQEKVEHSLKERLGHTPGEVWAGVVIGVVLSFLITKMLGLW